MKLFNVSSVGRFLKGSLYDCPKIKQYKRFSLKYEPITPRPPKLKNFNWALNILSGATGIFLGYAIHQRINKSNSLKCPATSIAHITTEKSSCPLKSQFSLAPILADANPAVVCVRLIKNNALVSEQSGFFVDNTGLTLTSDMDPSSFDQISIKTSDGRTFPGSLVEYDTSTGLCMLKIHVNDSAYFHSLTLLSKGDKPIETGDFVLTLGSTDSNNYNQFSFGIIKSYIEDDSGRMQQYFTCMAVEGNYCSGGPVLNMFGKVIGINQTKSNINTKSQIFIPVECGRSLLERIKQVHQIGCTLKTKDPVYLSELEMKLNDHKKEDFFR